MKIGVFFRKESCSIVFRLVSQYEHLKPMNQTVLQG